MHRNAAAVMVALALLVAGGTCACASPPKPVGMVRGRLVLIARSSIPVAIPQVDPADASGGVTYRIHHGSGAPVGVPLGPPDEAPVPAGSFVTIRSDAGGPTRRLPVDRYGNFAVQVTPGHYELGGSSPGYKPPAASCAGPGTVTVKRFVVQTFDVVCLRRGS